MNPLLSIILIGVAVGAALGMYVARRSAQDDAIHGGTPARIFHFLGAVGFSSALPAVLASVFFFHVPVIPTILTALGLVALSFVALLGYAWFERPARAKLAPIEEAWTAEKARTSGL